MAHRGGAGGDHPAATRMWGRGGTCTGRVDLDAQRVDRCLSSGGYSPGGKVGTEPRGRGDEGGGE